MGSGASVYAAASASWSEGTLAWSARPGPRGARLARVDGVSVNEPYTFELPASAVTAAGTYAFAVLPEASDTNSAHFDSKEVSAARGPILRLTIDPTMPPPDAGTSAPDVTTAPDVTPAPDVASAPDAGRPDAAAPFDAASDAAEPADVPSQTDAAAPTDGSSARPEVGADEQGIDAGPGGGCGCRAASHGTSERGLVVLAALALARAARRRREARVRA